MVVSCSFIVAADNESNDLLNQDSSNDNYLSQSSGDSDQSTDDSSSDYSSESDEDDDVNAEIDVDVVYDRNEKNAVSESSDNYETIDLTVHETSNPIILGLIAIFGIILPFRGRI